MKIVKFNNGSYAIRKRGLFGYTYLSSDGGYWFTLKYIDLCEFRTYQSAKRSMDLYLHPKAIDYGTPVNED